MLLSRGGRNGHVHAILIGILRRLFSPDQRIDTPMRRSFRCAPLLLVFACSRADTVATQHPQYGTWGVDLAARDTSVRPGDDFFGYANGAWLKRAEIPGDKPGVTLRLMMTDSTNARLHAMLDSAAAKAPHEPTDLEGKVGAYYKAFMDSTHVETLGATPLAPHLDRIRSATSRDAIAALAGRNQSGFNGTVFGITLDVDLKNPEIYSVYLGQSGLTLPDRDFYLKPNFAGERDSLQHYVATILRLIQWPDADARAKDIVAFETSVAKVSWDNVATRDQNAMYNPMSVAELVKFAPGFDWNGFLKEAGLTGTIVSSSTRRAHSRRSPRCSRPLRSRRYRRGRRSPWQATQHPFSRRRSRARTRAYSHRC